jgi:hypothetical protein
MAPRLAQPASSNAALPAWPARHDMKCDSRSPSNDGIVRYASSPTAPTVMDDEVVRSWLCLCPTRCCTSQPSKRDRRALSSGTESAESYPLKAQKVAKSRSVAAGPSSPHPPPTHHSLYGRLCNKPLHAYIVGGELLGGVRRCLQPSPALLQCDSWAELPSSWSEHQTSVVEPVSRGTGRTRTRYDKAFCVEWIGDHTMAVSTKCGHILQLHRRTQQLQEVELEGARYRFSASLQAVHEYRSMFLAGHQL